MAEQNNDSNSTALIAVTVSLLAMSTIAIFLRLLSRKLSSVKFWWDDGFICLGLVGERPGTRHCYKWTDQASDFFVWQSGC